MSYMRDIFYLLHCVMMQIKIHFITRALLGPKTMFKVSHKMYPVLRLCMGVLGSGENGVKQFMEQVVWGQKDQGAGNNG